MRRNSNAVAGDDNKKAFKDKLSDLKSLNDLRIKIAIFYK